MYYQSTQLYCMIWLFLEGMWELATYVPTIDPFHMRHSIAVTMVMYHMTYEQWRSSKKTESCIQAVSYTHLTLPTILRV